MVEQFGEWYFTSRPSRLGRYCVAWCAKTPDLGDSPLHPSPDMDVHFEFGDTEADALRKLKAEVLQ